ncbi:MAG: hypothetical protein JSV88_16520 [Candidatus Aminicenantes bacterium]|nr:MAG: hypothetical protein JSV88_16520 [Candidatus Aminicenantes bacterium]
MNSQIQDKIIENLRDFDSFQLMEVLDFVEYLNNKKREKQGNSNYIDLLFGKYRDKLSSSDMYAKSKKAEKEKEEMKWKTI